MPRELAIIPAYNEAGNIRRVVTECKHHLDRVLVVDDGSDDGTAALAEETGAEVLRIERNLGKGAALKHGFRRAFAYEVESVYLLDGDMEHDPELLPRFRERLRECDMVVGVRSRQRSYRRGQMNSFASFWLRQVGVDLSDVLCGFRALRVGLLRRMDLSDCRGFEVEVMMLLEAARLGASLAVVELPPVRYKKSQTSGLDALSISEAYDRWVLKNLAVLDVGLYRQCLLFSGAVAGLGLGRLWRFLENKP